jgi:putative SOS response-associated peptidase YedK
VGPGQWQPVLLWNGETASRMVMCMRWGLVPSWSHDATSGVHPINARCESLESKPIFSRLIQNKRCVVIADGYFEWKKQFDGKQPYFHRFPQHSSNVVSEMKSEKENTVVIKQEPNANTNLPPQLFKGSTPLENNVKKNEPYSISKPITFGMYCFVVVVVVLSINNNINGNEKEFVYVIFFLFHQAGLYDVWVNKQTGEELYTYTIITVPASKNVEWIHDRMPAILGSS